MKIAKTDQFVEEGIPALDNPPEGWESTTLKTIISLRKGKKPRKLEEIPWPGAVPYINIEAFETGNIRRYADPASSALVDAGHILVVWDGARCGHIGKAPTRGALGSTLAAIEPALIHPDFIFRFLQSCYGIINSNPRGIGIPHVEPELFWNLEVPLSPLAEQKRIVTKVEELLAQVNAVRERLTRVSSILKRFRQSVLAAACSGRLTLDWRKQNPAKETGQDLLNSILNESNRDSRKRNTRNHNSKFNENEVPDLPDSWGWATLGQITKNFDGQRVPIKADDRAKRIGQYPYYGASGVIDAIDDYLFDGEFLLIAEDGANLLSRCTPIAFRASGRFWVNNHAHIVQTYGGIPLQYVEGYLNGIDLQYYVTGSAQPKLTQEAMNLIPMPLPPLTEQHEIVRRVEALFKLADTIEKRVKAAMARAEKLTQAILAKAFRGELVPTEAELARREGREYEFASVLLARIKAELKRTETSKKRK